MAQESSTALQQSRDAPYKTADSRLYRDARPRNHAAGLDRYLHSIKPQTKFVCFGLAAAHAWNLELLHLQALNRSAKRAQCFGVPEAWHCTVHVRHVGSESADRGPRAHCCRCTTCSRHHRLTKAYCTGLHTSGHTEAAKRRVPDVQLHTCRIVDA